MVDNIVIDIKNVCRSFGTNKVLDNITFQVKQNDKFVVLGKSGSGKSVLFRIMTGLLNPHSGSVIINGHDISNKSLDEIIKLNLSVGMLFQSSALFDSLNIEENVLFSFMYKKHKFTKQQLRDIAVYNLGLVGLTPDILDKSPSTLSGGMQKRVALARLLVIKPKVLFFDEPTSGLDPITSMSIFKLIDSVSDYLKATSIIISHDMKIIDSVANNILVIDNANVVFYGSVEEFKITDNKFVKNFINGDDTK